MADSGEGFIFWKEDLQVEGSSDVGDVAERFCALVTVSGGSVKERRMGSIDGGRIHVWRRAPLAQAGDVVEFRGVLRSEGDGSVIEGRVEYNLRTKAQFVGCLVLGILLTTAGLYHWMGNLSRGEEITAVGAFITLATLVWIYSSRKLVWKQIAFIEDELARALVD